MEAAVLRSLVRLSEAATVPEAAFRRPIAPPPLASVEELKSSSVSLDIVEDTFKIMAILAQVLRYLKEIIRLSIVYLYKFTVGL